MKRIASIQDISCLGRCSLTVALPVISAIGVECAIVPTAVLSTHTMFQGFTCKDLTDQIRPIADHWAAEGFRFDALYTGYLASGEQIEDVCDFFRRFKTPDNLIFVDPAMADNGKLYPAFGPEFPAEMAKVVAMADIAVPNLTEACLLTGTEYKAQFTEDEVKALLRRLCDLGAGKAVLTGVGFSPRELGVMAYDPAKDEYFTYITDHEPQHYHGTGDLFASCTVGAMMDGRSLEEALKVAVDYTVECIRITAASGKEKYYGVEFERAIPFLLKRLGKV